VCHGVALAQGEWEFIGPDIGYRPEAFFVSAKAVYVGLTNENWATGYGLHRYRFDEEQWDLFAWEGYRITGVTVWGDSDENILLIRYGGRGDTDVLRSKDGGATWVVTYHWDNYEIRGLGQAPSDTSRVLTHYPVRYSTDGGWSWNAGGGIWSTGDVSFDPSNPLVAVATGFLMDFEATFRSTNGGATWVPVCSPPCGGDGVEFEREQTNLVMSGIHWYWVRVSTDHGETWSVRDTPFKTKMPHCPAWSPGTFFVAGSDSAEARYEVWRTEDFGDSWYRCGNGLPNLPEIGLWYISMYLEAHPSEPVLYAALEGSGVWRWDVSTSAAEDAGATSDPEIRLLLYPNPSFDRFTYGMRLSGPDHVILTLYDVHGRLLRTLKDGYFAAGTHVFDWRESDGGEHTVTSGIYYLRLDAGRSQATQKIALSK
jgi:hypothetical protein